MNLSLEELQLLEQLWKETVKPNDERGNVLIKKLGDAIRKSVKEQKCRLALPWKIVYGEWGSDQKFVESIIDSREQKVIETDLGGYGPTVDQAEFIVRCVNASEIMKISDDTEA